MNTTDYEAFIRQRITELRLKDNLSEHKMSLELGKSGSYIRSITSGMAMPSVKELFNIIEYFDVTPVEFFAPLTSSEDVKAKISERVSQLSPEDSEKVLTFIDWISGK